jgi:N-acyl amino acid synthase of PEP-CTERM/exosortase system
MSQINVAKTARDIENVLGVRHQVFCDEKGWEPRRVNRLESDHYDEFAHHIALTRPADAVVYGTVRIIPALVGNTRVVLPVERLCGSLRQTFPGFHLPERSKIAEASRLAVLAHERSGFGRPEDARQDERAAFTAVRKLMLACTKHAHDQGFESLLMLVEPKLLQFIGRYGVRPVAVGTPVEHRGTRVPCVLHPQSILETVPSID